jgi:predicted nucleic acid-binding protein
VSAQCRPFFKRVETGLLNASTSAAVVSEATHKVMLAEAIQRHGLAHQGLAHRLQRRRNLIATLSEHQKVGLLVRALGVRVEPVTLDVIEQAAVLSTRYLLLTNDAISTAVMQRLGLTDLVTNDNNFDSVRGLTIWKPR